MTGSLTRARPPATDRMPGFWHGRTTRWSKWDLVTIAAILLIAAGWMLYNLPPIEYGDPTTHWQRINTILAGDSFDVANHHQARFGIDGPVLAVRLVFGDHPNLYYLVPLLLFAVLLAVTYALGGRVFDRRVGVLAAVALALFPQSLRSGTQLLPGGFEATSALLATYFVFAGARSERAASWKLALAALLLFLGYLAKVQVALYAPGLVVAIWLRKRSVRSAAIFSGGFLGLVGLETLTYVVAPWTAGTRFEVLGFDTRLESYLPILGSPLDLFDRYPLLPSYWFWIFVFAAAGVLISWRWLDATKRAFLLPPASFLLVMTLGISTLSPLRPLIHFEARFLTSVIPFLLLFSAFLVLAMGDSVRRAAHGRPLGVFAAIAITALPVTWFVMAGPATALARRTETVHPMALNSATEDAVARALTEQRPIALRYDLRKGSTAEIRDKAKRLRFFTVFYFPIDTSYRAACFASPTTELLILAPDAAFTDEGGLASAVSAAGDVLMLSSDADDPWWVYRITEAPAREIPGIGLLDLAEPETPTISVREGGYQTQVGSLCADT